MLTSTELALDHRVAVEQRDRRVPSLIAAVARDGAPLWIGARGRVGDARPTSQTQYRIGSITKTFVSVMIMRLRDEGRLTLADPLDRHVPGTSFGDRTIGQLLSHASGISAEPPGSWWERSPGREWSDIAATTGPDTVRTRAGKGFHYTNLGFAALGEVIARLRGTGWFDCVRDEILLPLDMRRTSLLPTPPHATGWAVHPWADVLLPEPAHDAKGMAPAGQLWSTVVDLSRWAAFVGGDTGDVLSKDTVAEMRHPAVVDADTGWTEGYGTGLQLLRADGRHLAGHDGSMPGFLASMWIQAADGTAAVALANTTAGPDITRLSADLIDILVTREPRSPGEWLPMADADPDLLALTGQWYWGPSGYVLRLLADRWLELAPLRGSGAPVRFRPERDGTWTGLGGYYEAEPLRVITRADGSVDHLDLNTFVLTRTPYDPAARIPGGVDSRGWRGVDERH